MPDPSSYDNEDDWMEACMSAMHAEGKPQDQAVAACMQMWRDRSAPPTADRAWATLTVKAIDAEQRTIEGVASTPAVDRIGDIVEPMGASFTLPMPLLVHHKHDQPVGQVTAARASKTGIVIKAKFAKVAEPGALKDRVDTAWGEVKAGLVRGLSIGFKPIEYEPLDPKDPFGGMRFSAWNWYELSLVTIPANVDAAISVIKSLDQGLQAASGHAEKAVTTRPGASGKSSVNLKTRSTGKMSKTIQEQLSALEAKRAANAERMNQIMSKAMDEGRSTDDAEREEFDNLDRENETIDGDIKRFRALERTNAVSARALPQQIKTVEDGSAARGGNGAGGYIRVVGPQLPPGIRFARAVKCLGMAQGNRHAAAEIAERHYGDDMGIVGLLKAAAYYGELSTESVTKAAVNAATTTENQWAGVLVTASTGEAGAVGDFLEYLRPMSIVGKFGTNGIPALRRVPFRTGLIRQTSGGAGWWTGEAAAKNLTRLDFERRTLLPTKVANIAVVTEELLRDSSPSADTLVRDSLAAAITERIDYDFVDPAITASGARPASITNAATPIQSLGGTADQIRQDIMAVMAAFLAANNPPTQGVWIMKSTTALALSLMVNPLGEQEFSGITMNGGTFAGLPVIVSDYVPVSASPTGDYVILVNASNVWFADDGGLSVDFSREASLQMDDAATMTAGGTGASPAAPTAVSVVSMFQTNCVAFRAERTLNWAVARASGVQVLWGVNWGGS